VAARTQRVDGVADWRAGELIASRAGPKVPGATGTHHGHLFAVAL
jgi:hypothetical protein